MSWLREFLDQRKEKIEKRKQEAFLSKQIPLEDLFCCQLYYYYANQYMGGLTMRYIYKHGGIKVLQRRQNKSEDEYVDLLTGTLYEAAGDWPRKGVLYVNGIQNIDFSEEVIIKGYITIAELIELNKRLNENTTIIDNKIILSKD